MQTHPIHLVRQEQPWMPAFISMTPSFQRQYVECWIRISRHIAFDRTHMGRFMRRNSSFDSTPPTLLGTRDSLSTGEETQRETLTPCVRTAVKPREPVMSFREFFSRAGIPCACVSDVSPNQEPRRMRTESSA